MYFGNFMETKVEAEEFLCRSGNIVGTEATESTENYYSPGCLCEKHPCPSVCICEKLFPSQHFRKIKME